MDATRVDAIRMTTQSGSVTLPWDAFYRVKAAEDTILLYRGVNVYNLFCREFFANEGDWQTFRFQALAKVPAKPAKDSITRTLRILILWMAIFVVVILLYNLFQSR